MSVAYVVLACILGFVASTPAGFVPFGPSAGDSTAGACDDCSFGPFNFDFIFYGTQRHSLYVNNNGIISFTAPIGTFTPSGMSAANFPAIAIYWGDVDTRGTGTGAVYYRSTTDAALLASVSADVSSTFHGTHMFIATWDRVGYFSAHNNKLNTFQAVLIADDIGNSWVFLNYDVMQWTTGDASGGSNGVGGVPASVGFAAGDRITYVQTQESLTAAVVNTRDGLYQVNAGVISIPPPTQTCGNGAREGTEQCDGGACCTGSCTFATGVCRASAGSCDVAETCSGSSDSCPADTFAAASTLCRAASGVCDIAEYCSGSSASCSADSFRSDATVCRASAGECDETEFCTGSTGSCPADSFSTPDTVCRGSAGPCDEVETCSGSSVSCPADGFEPSTMVCRPAADNCDIAETCSGSTAACPADVLSMTGPCQCSRYQYVNEYDQNYFCVDNVHQFYQCVHGPWASQSRLMNCGLGTSCGCPVGAECSCNGYQSPCVMEGQAQVC